MTPIATFGVQPRAVFDVDTRIGLRVVLRRWVLRRGERRERDQRNGSPYEGILQGESPCSFNGMARARHGEGVAGLITAATL
jgi:hypothetical protein